MNNMTKRCNNKGGFCDFRNDFTLLTRGEKRKVLKTARTYWNLLKDNDALPANAENNASPTKSGKQIDPRKPWLHSGY